MADLEERLAVLDTQQALLTDCLKHMLVNEWVGFPSLEATLGGLSPGIQLAPNPPIVQSTAGPPVPSHAWDPHAPMPAQLYDWSCSCCSLEWTERALGASRGDDIYANREAVVHDVGYTNNVNPTYGLMDGSGAQLQRVLREHAGVESQQGWLTFDQAYAIYSQTGGLMSGGAYYHWVGCRGVDGPNLWISNSAPGYKSIWDIMSRADFDRLGPFSCIWIV